MQVAIIYPYGTLPHMHVIRHHFFPYVGHALTTLFKRELRQEYQLSIDDISKLSGLSHHRIKNVEQGKSFGLRRVAVIAAIYNYKLKFELIKAS